jgi:hypothetical protein
MVEATVVQTIQERIGKEPAPILSLYLDVNPAKPDNAGKAPVLRAKEALRDLDLDKSYIAQIVRKLKLDYVIPHGRTLVVFAGKDLSKLFEARYLQTDMPLSGVTAGVVARWGDPYLTPFLQAIDEQERYGVIFVDEGRWRYLEVFLGEIKEVNDAIRPVDTRGWRQLEESSTGMPGVPARGGSGKDLFERRLEEWSQRFYHRCAGLLEAKASCRLILMGPPEHVQAFEAALPGELRERVVERLPPPANPDATAHELLLLVLPVIARVEREQEQRLLEDIREKGVWGFEEAMTALLEGRLYLLALPWSVDRTVYHCLGNDRIAATLAQVAQLCPEGKYQPVLLKEVALELAEAHGVTLEFMRGEAEARLLSEFGGLAGLKRW